MSFTSRLETQLSAMTIKVVELTQERNALKTELNATKDDYNRVYALLDDCGKARQQTAIDLQDANSRYNFQRKIFRQDYQANSRLWEWLKKYHADIWNLYNEARAQ